LLGFDLGKALVKVFIHKVLISFESLPLVLHLIILMLQLLNGNHKATTDLLILVGFFPQSHRVPPLKYVQGRIDLGSPLLELT